MNKAFREWEEKNIQKGREEGRAEGEEKERSNAIQSVRMLFKNGASLELVSSSILVLSKEEIGEIYKEVCMMSGSQQGQASLTFARCPRK